MTTATGISRYACVALYAFNAQGSCPAAAMCCGQGVACVCSPCRMASHPNALDIKTYVLYFNVLPGFAVL